MCLASSLGSLITANQGNDCSYIIVSKDVGYDSVIKFWDDSKDVKVLKREMIKPPSEEENGKKKSSAKKTAPAKKEPEVEMDDIAKKAPQAKKAVIAKQTAEEKSAVKTEFIQEVQAALRQRNYSDEDSNELAKFVTDCYDEAHPEALKTNVHNGLQKNYDKESVKEIYHNIEPVLRKYSSMPVTASTSGTATDKAVLNNRVQQILSKAKMSADVIGYVASTVVKNFGITNGKQQIYQKIISKYGKEKGLDIYNRIKKYIP